MYQRTWSPASRQGVRVMKNIAYGSHPRHRLDIYTPEKKASHPLPVLIFVHGGGFVQGDKSRESNVGYYFARHGMLSLSINYRLAPAHCWPSGAEDMAEVLRWVRLHVVEYGGDGDAIFLMGHSAGAAHVSAYLFLEGFRPGPDDGILGVVLLSGPTYDTRRLNPQKDYAYYGGDTHRHPAMSVVQRIQTLPAAHRPSIFIGYAELDPPDIEYQALALYHALNAHTDGPLTLQQLPEHNHISEIMHINTEEEALGPDILEFFRTALQNDRG